VNIRLLLLCVLAIAIPGSLTHASQSVITETEGYACMGEDKSVKQTEQVALADAKKKASEFAATYIKSETHVKNYELEKDLTVAYSNATVKVITELEKGWYEDKTMGRCYKVKIKAEVVPDVKVLEKISKDRKEMDDPSAPLSVQVWTDRKEYTNSERIKVFIKGNKPFYARVIYKDAGGTMLQLLPNPYRGDSYFQGGVVYDIPAGNDRFELEVNPPFGEEHIMVYASTSPLGDINMKVRGGVYQITTKAKDVSDMVRGIKVKEKTGGKEVPASEFAEENVAVKTRR
jgi:hypothetical protein